MIFESGNTSNFSGLRISELEKRIRSAPNDLETRILLLKHYFAALKTSKLRRCFIKLTKGLIVDTTTKKHREHALWIFKNEPCSEAAGMTEARIFVDSDPVGCRLAIKQWFESLNQDPDDINLLRNAANNLIFIDPKFTRVLLERAHNLDSENLEWTAKLAYLKAKASAVEYDMLEAKALKCKWLAQQALWKGSLEDSKKWTNDQLNFETRMKNLPR